MKIRSLYLIALPILLAVLSCTGKEFKILDDGVVVNVIKDVDGGPQKVRLTVMSDRIIRVTATPDKSFHDRNSLIILQDTSSVKTGFVVRNHKDEVELQTTGLSAYVNKKDGKVRFTDAGGNSITEETVDGIVTVVRPVHPSKANESKY